MKKLYTLLSLIISLAMLISALPVGAFSEEEAIDSEIILEETEEAVLEEENLEEGYDGDIGPELSEIPAAPQNGEVAYVLGTASYYETFDEAMGAAADKDTIYVYSDCNFTLTTWKRISTIGVGATPPVISCDNEAIGKINTVYGDGTNLENITIDLTNKHVFGLAGGSVVHLNNGATVKNGYNSGNGGAFTGSANLVGLVMEAGSRIENSSSDSAGGAVFLNGGSAAGKAGKFIMNGGIITGCNTNSSTQGAVCINAYVDVTITGDATIDGNVKTGTEIQRNLSTGTTDGVTITVTGDFTGTIGYTKTAEGRDFSVYAKIEEGATGYNTEGAGFFSDSDRENSECVLLEDGETLALKKRELECYVNGDTSESFTLSDAIENATVTTEIQLIKDVADFTGDFGGYLSKIKKIESYGNAHHTITFASAAAHDMRLDTITFKNVTIDLNQCTNFIVYEGNTVTLDKGAIITNGKKRASNHGGAFVINHGATLIMNPGSAITAMNVPMYGAAVFLNGQAGNPAGLIMNGGTISGCKSTGGAVCLNDNAELKIGGNATIKDNFHAASATKLMNVWAASADGISVTLMSGDFTGSIGITGSDSGIDLSAFATIEAGAKGTENFFNDLDKAGYESVLLSNGKIKLKSNKVQLALDAAAEGRINVNGAAETIIEKIKGSEITMTNESDSAVKMWLDTSINNIVSEEDEVSFNLGSDINLKPIFGEAGKANVFFISKGDRVIEHNLVTLGEKVSAAPSDDKMMAEGYEFSSWLKVDNENPDGTAVEKNAVTNQTISGDTFFFGVYTKSETAKNITVSGGTIKDTALSAKSVEYDTKVTVVADTPEEGYEFAGWTIDEKIVSYKDEFTFFMGRSDVTITATYAPYGSVTKTPLIVMSKRAYKQGEYNIAQFLTTRYVPEGFTIIESGVIYARDSSIDTDVLATDCIGDKTDDIEIKVGRATFGRLATATQYNLSASFLADGIKARGYMVYTDAEGEVKTIYTDALSCTLSDITE